ncbi:MAG: hydrogenase [Tepidiforma sp.]|nr:MAG: hydrogenase [Tepidiforma sp.]
MPNARPAQGVLLIRAGVLLFLLGLLTGLLGPAAANDRLLLSSHLEAVLNGMFLMLLGLAWPRLVLGERPLKLAFAGALVGTYANWATTLLAAFLDAGQRFMPIAGAGAEGTRWEEALVAGGLATLTVAMLGATAIILAGLRLRPGADGP